MIHVVFGKSAEASLKFALPGKNHKIIGFPIDFSIGPIKNIHKKSGMKHYFTWLKSSCETMWSCIEEDKITCEQALQQLAEIKNGDRLTIWTCDNSAEQIGLRICYYLLKNSEVTINTVNTFKAMKDYTKHGDVYIEIRHTGECNPKQLAHFYEHSLYPISARMRGSLEQEGERLIQSESFFRSWKKGRIFHQQESSWDAFIINCAKKISGIGDSEFIHAVRLIGEVMGHSEQPLSDAWIEYRIRSLIHSGHLVYEGDLQSIRMYKIKVA
ncbi:DUF1835 domain-containing protein [Paraliobacillus sp. JSM ZJ581]|uniref:DUF1835 domain-containing protein n=1 Tax=Paraliobacillus sp. JSM ZJ581 TaxID=3342118 RepID=UPI0035A8CABC